MSPALDGDGAEELEEVVHDGLHEPEGAARPVVEDRGGAGFLPDREEAVRDEAERLLPRDGLQGAVRAQERRRETVGRVLDVGEARRPVAEEALRDRVGRVAAERDEPAVLDGRDQPAGVGAVAVADGPELDGAHGAILVRRPRGGRPD